MSPQSDTQNRLPFEPGQKKKKASAKNKRSQSQKNKSTRQSHSEASLSAIPPIVSKRMARRMAGFSGIPTALGMFSFFIFYWIKTQEIIDFPPYLVVLVTMGFFGLGVVGLSYGLLSTCWDENQAGSWLGID
ncbi:MAG: DUF3464 family protein [Cyanobacteria bacterium J083]|nr:MAG: DUF3464 family protein [Cyanobacteria bacterium J083]